MRTYHSNEIGNVVVLGHSGSGKTSVIEAMAYRAGAINRIGTIHDGNTLSDYDSEEIKRQVSINTTIIPLQWQNCKVNLLDTPGYFDFVGEVDQAIKAAESALIVVPATKGIAVGTKLAMEKVKHLPKMIFVNGLDNPNSAYKEKLEDLKQTFGKCIAPIQVPIMENNKMVGYINVAKMEGRRFVGDHTEVSDIPDNLWDEINPIKDMIDEAVANTNDELLEKYINEIPFTKEEISWALRQGVMSNTLVPVLCGTQNIGIQIILNSIVAFFPACGDEVNSFVVHHKDNNEDDIIGFNEALPASAFVFKTIADPFVGRISLFKVMTGSLHTGMSLYNTSKKEIEKITKLYIMKGKDLIEVDTLCAGDIGALSKLQVTETNDTLCTLDFHVLYDPIKYPTPYYTRAIKPIGKANEEKISNAISKLLEEDKTLSFESNPETKQQLLSGIGDQHLEITISKLKSKFKLDVILEDVILPYRETITKSAIVRGKHKKQSGGHGQYGDVEIKFEPSNDLTVPFIFEEQIFGGAVPKAYFPAVEKGLAECVKSGPLAGYPVIGIKATLLDGSYHNVDSSEMAFKLATALAFKEGILKAAPVLLEPYVSVNVYCDEMYTGDIMSDFNKKRGRVLGSDHAENGLISITAEVPQSEVMNYAVDLRSITQGQARFEISFIGYEVAPESVQKQVIANK